MGWGALHLTLTQSGRADVHLLQPLGVAGHAAPSAIPVFVIYPENSLKAEVLCCGGPEEELTLDVRF